MKALGPIRTALFVPGSHPDRVERARRVLNLARITGT
jgi:hypothetical protein